MQHAVESNVPFAHIDIIPVVKDAFKPPTGAVMNADHILFHAILKAGLTGKIRHHQLYARKNIIEPKICMAIIHRICSMADEGRRPRCYDFIFQIVQLLHRISPLPKSIAKTRRTVCAARLVPMASAAPAAAGYSFFRRKSAPRR